MDTVRKINMRRHTPDPLPGNFLRLFAVVFEFLNFRALGFHRRMAPHANRNGRPPGDDIGLDSLMTSGARKTLCDVFFVREFDGLFHTPHPHTSPKHPAQHSDNYKDENKGDDFLFSNHRIVISLVVLAG